MRNIFLSLLFFLLVTLSVSVAEDITFIEYDFDTDCQEEQSQHGPNAQSKAEEDCVTQLAIDNGDYNYCFLAAKEHSQRNCIERLAQYYDDSSYCHYLSGPSAIDDCYQFIGLSYMPYTIMINTFFIGIFFVFVLFARFLVPRKDKEITAYVTSGLTTLAALHGVWSALNYVTILRIDAFWYLPLIIPPVTFVSVFLLKKYSKHPRDKNYISWIYAFLIALNFLLLCYFYYGVIIPYT
jgi:hypothetical protein